MMIRKLKTNPQEIDRVMNLWLESTIKGHPFISKAYWQKNYALIRDVYIPKSDTFVYTENGELLGFISILDKSYIGALFVAVSHQGKGTGRKLLEYAYQTYGNLTLAVYKENTQALEFYIRRGFDIIDTQINEDSGHSECIMVKK